MSEGRWTESLALTALKRNGALVGEVDGHKTVTLQQPGLHLLGALDYLRTKHGYRWTHVVK